MIYLSYLLQFKSVQQELQGIQKQYITLGIIKLFCKPVLKF